MTSVCDECGSQGRCRPECSHVRPVGGDCWRCEGTRCDTHAEECHGYDMAAACVPCRACQNQQPDALAQFIRSAELDCVNAQPMSVVDEDRLTRRNPDWLDHHKFKGEQ